MVTFPRFRSLFKLVGIASIAAFCLTSSALHAQTLEFGQGNRSGISWGIGSERSESISIDTTSVTPGFATQENINVFAGGDTGARLRLTVTVNANNQIPKARVSIKTQGNAAPATYYFDLVGKSGRVTIDADQPLNSPFTGTLGSLNSVEYIEVKGQWNNSGLRTSFAVSSLTLPAATPPETPSNGASKTLGFGRGDRSGISWGIGTERSQSISINSLAVTPGFATQENINVFAGGDTSARLKLTVTVNANNQIPKARVAIKTRGNAAPANYYFNLTGLSGLVEIDAEQPLSSPAAGTLGDLNSVEYIEVKGQWNNSGLRTSFEVRSLTLPGTSNNGGPNDNGTGGSGTGGNATIVFGTGNRAGSTWGWEQTDRVDHISIDNSGNRSELMPGFATMENLDSFANLDRSSRLKLSVNVDPANRNNRIRVALGYNGGAARYYFDVNGSGELTADNPLNNPDEGSLPANVSLSFIEIRGAESNQINAFDVISLSTGTSGESNADDNAIARNTFNRNAADGRLLDFEHLNNVRSVDLPFEWRTRGTLNKYYSFFDESDGIDHNDDMFTTNLYDSHDVQTDTRNSSINVNFRTNSHREASTNEILGDFRINCQWSHFAYDDPIVFSNSNPNHPRAPGPNKSHLHMFWGNTDVDWKTNITNRSLDSHITNRGGSSCNGGALNRSSYWMPALMHKDDHAMVPHQIVVYYKTWEVPQSQVNNEGGDQLAHHPRDTKRMPQGLQLIAGNGNVPDDEVARNDANDSRNLNRRHAEHGGIHFAYGTTSENIHWSCGGKNGYSHRKFNRIPTLQEWQDHCPNESYLNATIYFPQCMQDDVGTDSHLRSSDFRSHVADSRGPEKGCPSAFPNRIPRLGYQMYWEVGTMIRNELNNPGSNPEFSFSNLRLSSDPEHDDYERINGVDISQDESGLDKVRGGTLHADWVAGWHDKVMDMWIENCTQDGANCSVGQTGTGLSLRAQPEDFDGFLSNSNQSGNYMIDTPHGSMMNSMSGM